MTSQIRLREEPSAFESEFAPKLIDTEWETVVNRKSPNYIKWVQQSLNQIMGLRLAVDGDIGPQTRSAIRTFQRHKSLKDDGAVGAQTERALIAAGASPFPGAGAITQPGVVASAAPTLVKPKELTPPAYTLYAHIPLQNSLGRAKTMTGIFIPENYCPQPSVDLIVYLHGYKYRAHKPSFSIDSYWRLPQFLLREAVNKSRKNLILVAPTLGPKNEPGILVTPRGFDKFLDQVTVALKQYGPYTGTSKAPPVGNLILVCHSGSGWVMRAIARGGARYAAQIREFWAFDPYSIGDASGWANWARSAPNSKLYIYYRPNSPGQKLSDNLGGRRPSNILASKSQVGHDDMPAHYLAERIDGAQFLAEKSNCLGKRVYTAEQDEHTSFESEFSFLENMQYALAAEEWNPRLMLAWYMGSRDENKLTNMIFFNRHPERDGRKVEKSEPNFRELSREWLAIRDQIVRPFLAKAAAQGSSTAQPTAPVVASKPYPDVNTQLPKSGPGLYGTSDQRAYHRFGHVQTIQALQAVGQAWQQAHPQGPRIGIGDISLSGGGDTPNHASHEAGLDVDIRLMRNDGRENSVRYQDRAYSLVLTQELVNRIINNSVLPVRMILFNDPVLRSKIVRPYRGHDDHLHVRFCAPASFMLKLSTKHQKMYKCT